MKSEHIIYSLLFICCILLFGIFIYQYNRIPCLIGLSIHDAEKKLLLSGKKIKLGTKVGFIEPPQGKPYLLGKIAEQIIEKPNNDDYSILHYKLYQINVDRLFSQFSNPSQNYQDQKDDQYQPEIAINLLPTITFQHEIYSDDEEEPIPPPMQMQIQPQVPIPMEIQPQPLKNIVQDGPAQQVSFQSNSNAFKADFQLFPIPKADNNTRQYGNKTSYFW